MSAYDKMKETQEKMADAIIKALDAGEASGKWVMPWDRTGDFPTNPTTGKTYGGSSVSYTHLRAHET